VVVSHGHLLALVLQAVDRTFGFEAHAAMTNPDVFLLERPAGGPGFPALDGPLGPARFERLWGRTGAPLPPPIAGEGRGGGS
jgi:hypothetical protein